jgi:hypothetical protein
MSTELSDQTAEKLRKALEALPAGPWEVWTSCSYRRVTSLARREILEDRHLGDGGVLRGTIQRSDNHPDLNLNETELQALCDLRNLIAELVSNKDDPRRIPRRVPDDYI